MPRQSNANPYNHGELEDNKGNPYGYSRITKTMMPAHNDNSFLMNEPNLLMQPSARLRWHDLIILVVGYIALDWVSYFHPLHGLNITPWSPAPAFGLIYLLRFGRKAVLPIVFAIFIADVVIRGMPATLPWSIALSTLLAVDYWLIAEVLRRRMPGGGGIFYDRQRLMEWAAIITIGTFLDSLMFASALWYGNLIPVSGLQEAFVRYWVGDGVGILVTMPILWMLFDDRGRAQLRAMVLTGESLGYVAGTALALWIAFGIGANANFKYLYVLFLPIAWAGARQGLAGAVVSAAMVQLGIIGAVQVLNVSAVTVIEIQSLNVVLALFGFFIGVVVDEKQRVSAELRQTLRLAAAGEMAGALAHELNQPLTALTAYGATCEYMLENGETGERLKDTIRRMVSESFRAADVVRRLRDFFRTGATQLELVALSDLLETATSPFVAKAQSMGVSIAIEPIPEHDLLIDRLQMEVVLRNLLSNALDVVADQRVGQRKITVSVTKEGASRLCIQIDDSGPGLSDAKAARIFEAFQSSKSTGLGLGLVISRAIVEAHGGQLWAEVADHGLFKITLPIDGAVKHAA